MIRGVEHLFMCLLAICISSMKKIIFNSLPIFEPGFSLLLNGKSHLYSLDIKPVSDM